MLCGVEAALEAGVSLATFSAWYKQYFPAKGTSRGVTAVHGRSVAYSDVAQLQPKKDCAAVSMQATLDARNNA